MRAKTNLIMTQPDPARDLVRNGQDVPQHVDLQLVEVFVHRRFEQGFELMDPVLDLQLRGGMPSVRRRIVVVVFFGRRPALLAALL